MTTMSKHSGVQVAIAGKSAWRRWLAGATVAVVLAALLIVPVTQGADDDVQLYPLPVANYGRLLRVTGLAEPGQAIRIEIDGAVVARTRANANGDFVAVVTPAPGVRKVQAVEDGKRLYPDRSRIYAVRHAPPAILARAGRSKAPIAARSMGILTAAPSLDTPPAASTANPVTLTGTAPGGSNLSFFVNGRYTRQIEVPANGTFSTWVPLEDGQNSIYATADDGSGASPASNTVEIAYTNTLSRSYGATTISTPTVWTAGSAPTYTLNGALTIGTGGSLWIQPGVTVSVSGNYKILAANGELAIRGTASQRVTLRPSTTACTDTTPRRTDWIGVETTGADGRVSTEHADVFCADDGIFFNGGTGSVRDSRIRNGGHGVRVNPGSPDRLISPLIAGGNEIRGNTYGVHVTGSGTASFNPAPVVNGNSMQDNSSGNYYANTFGNPATVVLDARDNWWGTSDPASIANSIRDRKNSTTAPFVDFGGYLADAGGPPASSDGTLVGPVTTSTLAPGVYQMLGDVVVNSGVTWTLSPGVTIRSMPGRRVQVAASGRMDAIGSATQRVHFTSVNPYPAKGDWDGIEVLSGGVAVLDYARVEYAESGIDFNGGQGTVSRSLLRFNETGVYVRAKSNPTIHQGNQISHGDFGINVRSNLVAADNPLPVVNGNSLFANASYNYYTSGFSTPKPTLDATGNWWGIANEPGIAATIFTGSSSSTIVDTSGYLSSEPVPQAMLLTDFSMSAQQVRPLITPQVAEGVFTINRGGSVTYRVLRDADGAIVRQWTQSHATPGQYAFQWNGMDDQGAAVSGGLYRMVLIATDGLDPYVFDVPMPSNLIAPSGSLNASYNPYLNQSYKVNLSFSQSSLASLVVTPSGGTPFYAFQNLHYPAGTHWIYWDGRAPDGSLVTAAAASTFATDAQVMRANGIFAYTPAITITGTGAAPNIEVKSDPYLVTHSFEQASSIVYRIDADAVIRVTMLPPGIVDPAHASAIVLVNNVTQSARDSNGDPIDHTVVWRGYNDTDPNAVLVSTDGAYTFAIEATLPATGRKTTYRGVLSMVQ